jgi:hypothetical protein
MATAILHPRGAATTASCLAGSVQAAARPIEYPYDVIRSGLALLGLACLIWVIWVFLDWLAQRR